METWREIEGFSGYSVSDFGRVRNDETDHILALMVNQRDIIFVGMSIDGFQYKRSVAILVARAFLPDPINRHFNTPIHLDGDRWNNAVENLMWRPRWFAVAYMKQFRNHQRGFVIPIQDKKSGEIFATSWDAATKYGLIDEEIRIATLNRTYVWPTYQEFIVLS
jgi:hypothetical protein